MKSNFLKIVVLNIFITLLLVLALEGFASLLLSARESRGLQSSEFVAETIHTKFDPLLGWINQPNIRIEDMYGKGVYLATNSQAFRNERDFKVKKAPGVKRILCVGDSFTLGYGVSNKQTWCNKLAQNNPNVETVNMGQGGYGVDQAYLWYKRDGIKLEHDLVIFAFITSDFYRQQMRYFSGRSKPFLTMENDSIKVQAPSQPGDDIRSAKGSALGTFLNKLRTFQLIEKLKIKLRLLGSSDKVLSLEARTITAAMFEDLKATTSENNAGLLLVHLPNADDYPANSATDSLRNTLEQISGDKGLSYLDLVRTVQNLPSAFDANSLFQYGNQHFNVKGNNFVARQIQPEIDKVFASQQDFN